MCYGYTTLLNTFAFIHVQMKEGTRDTCMYGQLKRLYAFMEFRLKERESS